MDQLCRITRGSSPRPINDWIAPTGTPWVKIADATRTHSRFITSTRECIRDEGRRFSVVVAPGDLILSNSATPGMPKFMGIEACIHDGWLLLRDFDGAIPQYLYYRLLLDRPVLVGLGNGSVFTNLKTDILKSHVVPLPPLDEQRRIAGVLGSHDDLIEANLKLAENLRALVRTSFRQLLEGPCSQVSVGDNIGLKYGKALPARDREPGPFAVVSSAGVVGEHSSWLVRGPGIAVGRKGTVGSVTWVPNDFYPIDTAFYVETGLPMLFVYLSLEALGLSAMNTDSAVPGLNRENALSRRMSLPGAKALESFMSFAMPLWQSALEIEDECAMLRTKRDQLLPHLLSGAVIAGELAA